MPESRRPVDGTLVTLSESPKLQLWCTTFHGPILLVIIELCGSDASTSAESTSTIAANMGVSETLARTRAVLDSIVFKADCDRS